MLVKRVPCTASTSTDMIFCNVGRVLPSLSVKLDNMYHFNVHELYKKLTKHIWVKSRKCGCLVTWFCYHLIAKPGNKTAAIS